MSLSKLSPLDWTSRVRLFVCSMPSTLQIVVGLNVSFRVLATQIIPLFAHSLHMTMYAREGSIQPIGSIKEMYVTLTGWCVRAVSQITQA